MEISEKKNTECPGVMFLRPKITMIVVSGVITITICLQAFFGGGDPSLDESFKSVLTLKPNKHAGKIEDRDRNRERAHTNVGVSDSNEVSI